MFLGTNSTDLLNFSRIHQWSKKRIDLMHKKSKPTWTHFHSFFAALLTRIVKLKGPKIHLPFFLCIFLAHSQKPFQEKFSLSKVLSVEIKSLSCAADYWSSFQSIFSRSKTLIIATQKNSHANKAENLAHTTISSWGSRSDFKEKRVSNR